MKLFTVAEANALLPAVREILKKIQAARKKLGSYRNQAKASADQAEQGGGGFSDGLRYADLLIDLTSQTSELEVLGVQLKDFDRGLVDFPHCAMAASFCSAGRSAKAMKWSGGTMLKMVLLDAHQSESFPQALLTQSHRSLS